MLTSFKVLCGGLLIILGLLPSIVLAEDATIAQAVQAAIPLASRVTDMTIDRMDHDTSFAVNVKTTMGDTKIIVSANQMALLLATLANPAIVGTTHADSTRQMINTQVLELCKKKWIASPCEKAFL